MKNLGYYNGKIGPIEEMTIPMNDRACWFGDGIYDAGPCRNYNIFALDEHVDRLFRNTEAIDIEVPVSKEELKALLNDLVCRLEDENIFVYFQVTRGGTGMRNHIYSKEPGNLWIMMKPGALPDTSKKLKLITEEDTRFFHCNTKTLNLLPSVMAATKAENAGCDEAVLYRPGGRVTECSRSNVHILKDGVLRTAPTDELILPGIARAHLLRACEALGIPYVEEPFYLEDLFSADEVLVTSSGKLCVSACEIDGKPMGGKDRETFGRLADYLFDEFMRATE